MGTIYQQKSDIEKEKKESMFIHNSRNLKTNITKILEATLANKSISIITTLILLAMAGRADLILERSILFQIPHKALYTLI